MVTPSLAALRPQAAALRSLLAASGVGPDGLTGALDAIVQAQPDHLAARLALCAALWQDGARDTAVAQSRILAARLPGDAEAAADLAMALLQTGALAEGLAEIEALGPRLPPRPGLREWQAHALWTLGRWRDAAAATRLALAQQPDSPALHGLLASRLLASGDWTAGWPEFAWRWRLDDTLTHWRRPTAPLERPDPAQWRGRTVLLYAEQGHGDTLMCLRYLASARATGARLVLEVQPALRRLARRNAGDATVVAQGEPVPPFDIAVPMLHLPWAFGTTPDTVPAAPYLTADPAATARWRQRLAPLGARSVGLVWAGATYRHIPEAHAADRKRSTTLAALAPLAAVPGIALVSLQLGEGAAQVAPPGMVLHDWTAELADFADTAALMAALDLVITVDTACVHLAGALGRPVWMLNRHDGCWRWLRDRDDSPWYPTLRQFQQGADGEWGPVIRRVAEELGRFFFFEQKEAKNFTCRAQRAPGANE